jgi:phenylalanyl-tRNA synthetase beta chain
VRVPLSWLRDFAPFEGDPADLAATLDDLGLVVEGMVRVGEGLADVVVARVAEISAIAGADKIRRVTIDASDGLLDVVCGAWNFEVDDLVPFAPVGAVLPGDFRISRRKMKGVVSNGMLCSGRELNLSDEHQGIMVLNDVEGAHPGQRFIDAMGIEPDVVFDIAVEANRPDAWSVAGVARDLAARLGLPFAIPEPTKMDEIGPDIAALASVRLDDHELCPRFTAKVITGVTVGPSPKWLADRLTLAGMRPINNVVDVSNYVMLELGQPTHPYDLDRLNGGGLVIRRAVTGETVTTLDGVERVLGRPGPGLGDTGDDCLICDAEGIPVAIGGVLGGASCEIDDSTTRVLLEAAYFVPMAIARTSKRLTLRTEASARFERGCDPEGIDRAVARFCDVLNTTIVGGMTIAKGMIDRRLGVPEPVRLTVRSTRVNGLLGTAFSATEIADLLAPLGIEAKSTAGDDSGALDVTVPTYRPDIRPAPMGEADLTEEVARTYGYSRLPRRRPSWPQPGRLTDYQRDRRQLKDILCGLGASEAWTGTFGTEFDQMMSGIDPPYVEVANPLVESERFLRSSMAPGLVRAVQYNAERRQGDLRLFEVGTVFHYPESPPVDPEDGPPAETSERLSAVFCAEGDDSWTAMAAWHVVADAFRLANWVMMQYSGPAVQVLHQYRSTGLSSVAPSEADEFGVSGRATSVGVVGELDPYTVGRLGLLGKDGRPRRVGWLDLDIDILLDRDRVPRRTEQARPISRFPSSDIDLAFVVDDKVSSIQVARTLQRMGGGELESVGLFDVFRGEALGPGCRSLAYRLRFCSVDHTLTDDEIATLRTGCIDEVARIHQATLRQASHPSGIDKLVSTDVD